MTRRKKASYRIRTVDQTLDILQALSEIAGDVSVTDLSEKLTMNKSSIFRFLTTFEQRGYLEPSENAGKYRVGVAAAETCQKLLTRINFISCAKPVMEMLAREWNEDVYLAVPQNGEILLLDAAFSVQKVQIVSQVGKRSPLAGSAAGQVVLAYGGLPEAAAGMNRIRELGACIDHTLMGEGISSIAVPIRNARKEIAGCLCMVGPSCRMSDELMHEELLPSIREAAQSVSARLGYTQPGLPRSLYCNPLAAEATNSGAGATPGGR